MSEIEQRDTRQMRVSEREGDCMETSMKCEEYCGNKKGRKDEKKGWCCRGRGEEGECVEEREKEGLGMMGR